MKTNKFEDLSKEMYDLDPEARKAMLPFHGWVAPSGEFHELAAHADHYKGLYNAMATYGEAIDPSQHEDPLGEAHRRGWVSLGSAGWPVIQGHSKVLNDPDHPVVQELAARARKLPPSVTQFHINYSNRLGHKVPRKLVERGILKRPTPAQLARFGDDTYKSESLAKASWRWHPSFHGLISPEGKLHGIEQNSNHFSAGKNLGLDGFQEGHNDKGWIGVGHMKDNWVSMGPVTHDDPEHPATKALVQMVHQHPTAEEFTVISSTGEEWKVPRALAQRGIFKKPSMVQQFRRSEDLNKSEIHPQLDHIEPPHEGIAAAEEAWQGGLASFGDPEAAHLVQQMPKYFDYISDVRDALKNQYGDKPIKMYRAMHPEQLAAWRNGDDIGPTGWTTKRSLAQNWHKLAGHKSDVPHVLVSTHVDPEHVVMRGSPQEHELVIDSNQIEGHKLREEPHEPAAPSRSGNWVPNTDEQIGQEYDWEYQNHTKHRHGDIFPTLDHFKTAVKNAKIQEVTPEFDRQIGNRSRTKSVEDLKDLTSQYRYPRDVNRIVTGLKNDHPIPHPIVLKHKDGRHEVMSGNTRMDAAFIHGVNPTVAIVDVPDKPTKTSKSEDSSIPKGAEGECYRNATKHAMVHGTPGMLVVHGHAKNMHGETIHHAWIEHEGKVIDPTVGVKMDKDKYYAAAHAEPHAKYTPEQAMINMARNRHHGPWTAQEASKGSVWRKTDKSEDLEKGVMQRIAPYSPPPHSEKAKDPVGQVYDWQGTPFDAPDSADELSVEKRRAVREQIPRMEGHERQRALHKLAANTRVRRHADGGKEFLLHRGMSSTEFSDNLREGGSRMGNQFRSSWTPRRTIADKEFGSSFPNKHTVSAWVHEKHIIHVPKQLGGQSGGKNMWAREHEVIVDKAHNSEIVDTSKDTSDLHQDINRRAKRLADTARVWTPYAGEPGNPELMRYTAMDELRQKLKRMRGTTKKSESLEKGAMQRLARFNPQLDVDADEEEQLRDWQQSGNHDARESIPYMSGAARTRALHKLTASTKVRRNPETGRREFLLHRGMSPDEHESAVTRTHVINDSNTSSWTPDREVAGSFAQEYGPGAWGSGKSFKGKLVSAWVDEMNIHHVPYQLGKLVDPYDHEGYDPEEPRNVKGPNKWAEEQEVLVSPHQSKRAFPFQIHKPSIHDEINLRNAFKNNPETRKSFMMQKLKTLRDKQSKRNRPPKAPKPPKPQQMALPLDKSEKKKV